MGAVPIQRSTHRINMCLYMGVHWLAFAMNHILPESHSPSSLFPLDLMVNFSSKAHSSYLALRCPVNSHYEICANLCVSSCANLAETAMCPESCAEGCECDDDFFFDGLGCVPADSCGSFKNGRYYKVVGLLNPPIGF